MCGIVGAVTQRNIVPVLLEGLQRLEYRGYDSCGVAVHDNGLYRARGIDRVADLKERVSTSRFEGRTGIAHTRWATHGLPVASNAHPHFSSDMYGIRRIAVVHNGIIENYEEIGDEMRSHGYRFESQTDTEVIAHLLQHLYDGDLFRTVQKAVKRLKGAFAIAVFCRNEPQRLVGARSGCPLVVGLGSTEHFLASDALALAGTTDQIIYLQEGDVVDLRPTSFSITDKYDQPAVREVHTVDASVETTTLAPYEHHMQKEIFEQPRALTDTIASTFSLSPAIFGEGAEAVFKSTNAVLILACGTSYYAGLTAKYWLESIAGVQVTVEVASEYRYRKPAVNPNALVLAISQSGETADTLAALKYAQELGHHHSLAICNVATSAMVRETTLHFLTRAGREIGVASTKAFTTQLAALFVFTLTLAKLKQQLTYEAELGHLAALERLPSAVQSALALEPQIMSWANQLSGKEHALFLGRGSHYPIALEGALKLKEISYIHAEAYPAGELKHGPLALVTSDMPVVVIAPNDALIEKLKSNIQEVKARGGRLFVLADVGAQLKSEEGVQIIRLPANVGALSPVLHVVPLQLLAYHTAVMRGTDIDKPRNLAKSVTVE